MLSELCKEINNWFNYDLPKNIGTHTISGGQLVGDYGIQQNQYYRIVGSVFNDGVHIHPDTELIDETFHGGIWLMAVPKEILELSQEIDDWLAKYGGVESAAMSPFTSENFGGYSYSKG